MNNEATFDDAGPFEKMVSFEISSFDLNRAMNRASRQISRQVSIPGFRPGRAPRRLVERRVGADRVRADALDDLVPARMGEILYDTEIVPVVPPLLESVMDTANGSVKVAVRVTTWPRLESLPDFRDRRVEVLPYPPVSQELDNRLEHLRHMYSPLRTVDRAIEEGDFAVIDMTVTDGERILEALGMDGLSYEVGSKSLAAEIDEGLRGRRAGEEFEMSAPLPGWYTGDDGAEEASPEDEGEGRSREMVLYRVRVVEVQARSLPDLDDDWASEYTGHDSLEELREEMREEVEEERNTMQWDFLVSETVKELIDDLDLELPERLETAQAELLLNNHLHVLDENNVDFQTYLDRADLDQEEFIDMLQKRAVAGLKTRILLESVIETLGLAVEDADVTEFLENAVEDADDPRAARRQIEGVNRDQLRSDMLTARARSFLAMQVQPIDGRGDPVAIRAPDRVKAWFEPPADTEQNPNLSPDDPQPVYEAEVIDDA